MKKQKQNIGLKLNIQKTKIMASGPITSWDIDGERVRDFIFGLQNGNCNHEIKTLTSWKKSYDQPREHIKKQKYYSANKSPSSKSYGFSSSHAQMWELEYKEGWAPVLMLLTCGVGENSLKSLAMLGD